jgi:hypothetical protein
MSKSIQLTVFRKVPGADLDMLRKGDVQAFVGGILKTVGRVTDFAVKGGEVQAGIRLTHDETQRQVQGGSLIKTLHDRSALYLADEGDTLAKFQKLHELPPTSQPLQKREPWAPLDAPLRKVIVVPYDEIEKVVARCDELLAENDELIAVNKSLLMQVDAEGRLRKQLDVCDGMLHQISDAVRGIDDAVRRLDDIDGTLRRIEDNEFNSGRTSPRPSAEDQTRERHNQSFIRTGR